MTPEDFIRESNRIEGILRDPTKAEVEEYHRFMAVETVGVSDLEHFVSIYQPEARLREQPGMNVRVGNYTPPLGGPRVVSRLADLLSSLRSPYWNHLAYENLHPFTDCNGRSGRILWLWQLQKNPAEFNRCLQLGFLHTFYYQTLTASESHQWRKESSP